MQVGRIKGTTRVLGKDQGYFGLPIRDITIQAPDGSQCPAMESAWLLGGDEMGALLIGAPLVLRVLGSAHPPVHLRVDKTQTEHQVQSGVEQLLPVQWPLGAKCKMTERCKYYEDWKDFTGFICEAMITKDGTFSYTVCTMLPDKEKTDGFLHDELELVW